MMTLSRYAAPLATLALAALIVGCPGNNNNNPAGTGPTAGPNSSATKKPSASPSATPTASPSATTAPTASPTSSSTLPPGTPAPNASASPSAKPSASATPSAAPTIMMATPTPDPVGYQQVERLGRPAINEGLMTQNNLLNTWNAVPPAVDITTDAKPIADEATAVLKALGNNDTQVTTLFTQLLPDVMRIDTTKKSGYATSFGNANPLALDNVSTPNGIPHGGRMITDDVMDVTLILIVPGGLPAASPVPGLESDGVAYADAHDPVLADFPYLVPPN